MDCFLGSVSLGATKVGLRTKRVGCDLKGGNILQYALNFEESEASI
jgi:hypothetical protein